MFQKPAPARDLAPEGEKAATFDAVDLRCGNAHSEIFAHIILVKPGLAQYFSQLILSCSLYKRHERNHKRATF